MIVERFLFLVLSPPGDRWCGVLGFVPAVSVSISSELQLFRDTSQVVLPVSLMLQKRQQKSVTVVILVFV